VQGYRGIALTDHVGLGSLERVIRELAEDCRVARSRWNIVALPGVELTHVPPGAIAEAARRAKELGASIVIVHGETLIEPVEPGTNLAAVQSGDVDILAHPGLLSLEEARLAGANGVLVEISARKGHCLTNGYIARLASATGMKLVLNSDAHDSPDLLTKTLARDILKGSGLTDGEILEVMETNPLDLVARIAPVGHS
jgi:putative hydrolase